MGPHMPNPPVEPDDHYAHLTQQLITDVSAALHAHHASAPDDPVMSVALCTDDDACGVYFAICTASWLRDCEDSEDRFQPTEWPEGSDAITARSQALVEALYRSASAPSAEPAAGDVPTVEDHVRQAFEAMVGALRALRQSDVIGAGVFTVVCSTDPGPLQEALEQAAIQQLNSSDVRREYVELRLQWANNGLKRLLANDDEAWWTADQIGRLRAEMAAFEHQLSELSA